MERNPNHSMCFPTGGACGKEITFPVAHKKTSLEFKDNFILAYSVRDITKLSGYPRSNVKTRLEQSNYYLASGRFPLQNAIYDNKLPFSRM